MSDRDNNLDLFPSVDADLLATADDPEILERWPQGLTDLIEVIQAAYRRAGDDAGTARDRAFRAVIAISHFHGGQVFYLPRGEHLQKALRDRRIWEEFNGHNQNELAEQYHLTVVQIYAILKRQRKLDRKRHQRDLFPSGE